MTGRDLIIYILTNHLEDEKMVGFLSDEEMAVKLNIGIESVHTMFKLGLLQGAEVNGKLYFFPGEQITRIVAD